MWGYVRLRHLLCVRPTGLSATNLGKLCTVQPTYSRSDTLNLCIRPAKDVHPTYKSCASDLLKLCIVPTEECSQLKTTVQPTYSRSDTLTFFFIKCVSDQQQLEAAEKPRAGRSEVSLDGCNVGRM